MSYVLRHKYFVFSGCFKAGLYKQGILHDISKFRLSEWFPYANFFYDRKKSNPRDDTGYCKPTDTGDKAFDYAWLLHQKRNKHHWQFWLLPEDEGGMKILPMPSKYRMEMVCDWIGASRAQGYGGTLSDVSKWYAANKDKMQLHPETRAWVEKFLGQAE